MRIFINRNFIEGKDVLGRGSFGRVSPTSNGHVIKALYPGDSVYEFRSQALIEISNLAALQECRYVPRIYDVYLCGSYAYTMERYKRPLNELIWGEKLDFEHIPRITYQIVMALAYAQSKCILHRDVKPDNILVDENYNIVVADWGISHQRLKEPYGFGDDEIGLVTPAQTLWYRCPEYLFELSKYENNATMDMWSVGMVVLELLLGKIIMYGTSHHRLECSKNLKTETCYVSLSEKIVIIERLVEMLDPPRVQPFKSCVVNMVMKFEKGIKNYYTKVTNYHIINLNKCKTKIFSKTENTSSHGLTNYISENLNVPGRFGEVENKKLIFCCNFIDKCLTWSPNERITPYDALDHPFISEWNVEYDINHQKIMNFKYLDRLSVNRHNILHANPLYITNPKARTIFYRRYSKLAKNCRYVISDISLMLRYTDKLAELVVFKYDNIKMINYIAISISLIVSSLLYEDQIEIEVYNELYRDFFDPRIVRSYMDQILAKLSFPLIKITYVDYQDYLHEFHSAIPRLYLLIASETIKNFEYVGYSDDTMFYSILLIIKKYSFKLNNEVVDFEEELNELLDQYKDCESIEINFGEDNIPYNSGTIIKTKKRRGLAKLFKWL